ncbi:DNA translocase FtsK [Enterococcus sp. LJL98]
MAKKKRPAKKRKTKKQQLQEEKLTLVGLGILFILFALAGLFKLGFLGNLIANGFRVLGGNSYPLLTMALAFYGGFLVVKNTKATIQNYRRLSGMLLMYLALLLFLHGQLFGKIKSEEVTLFATTWHLLLSDIKVNQVTQNVGGGMLGALLYQTTNFLVARIGSYVIAFLLFVSGAFLTSTIDSHELVEFLSQVKEKMSERFVGDPDKKAYRQVKKAEKKAERQAAKEAKKEAERAAILAEIEQEKSNTVRAKTPAEQLAEEQKTAVKIEPEQMSFVPIDSFQENPVSTELEEEEVKQTSNAEEELEESSELDFEIPQEVEDEAYELPPSSLLQAVKATDQSSEYKKIELNIGVLERTFESFGVDAKVVKASLGPSVTKFEIQPAVGVKVSKIVNLTDDIALALAAKDIRMEAPIPGKSLIGIEVPNDAVSTVSFKEIVENNPAAPENLLEVPLGRDISGRVQTADLTKMPHLLVAGSTGSGKSVAINGIITSILMRAKPHEVKLMMVDPKMVELNVYNGIPHLLTPVVTNPRRAAQALQKVVKEMEERYEKFAASGVRNITGYNEMIQAHNAETGEKNPILPFIVVIVDELADLMMVASNEVEDAIIRLAQMARAAGIHMILATQRPSVDVITGIIKANVPSRMAFAVSSGTDSRTIIDSNGAEKLLGRGDMLFLPMGENKPIRVQGAFTSDQDVEAIVKFVTDQQGANYVEEMMVTEEDVAAASGATALADEQDELYDQARDLVVEMQTASVSLLQRRFRVGYNRAARLVDQLEANGIVGPSEGSKPRKVLVAEELEVAEPPYEEFE